MGILGRLSSLIKSNVNDVIDSMQDPAKEIDQMVRDMEESARQARTEVAECLGTEKRLQKRVTELEAEAAEWVKRAETAVRAGRRRAREGGAAAQGREGRGARGDAEGAAGAGGLR